ncbi:polysaccharide deacetylase family protein [Streptomyces polyrhachis]|uniref:Polysaccharide deacetylase family protein n=1 Tax=Streptomyces polyrhachis TaxID=1282885 RepID=A0ABW2GFP2_9ACTN
MGTSRTPRTPRTLRTRRTGTALAVLLLTALAATSCGRSGESPEHDLADARNPRTPADVLLDSRTAAAPASVRAYRSTEARALAYDAWRQSRAHARRTAAARTWGLARAPLLAPLPPAAKPRLTTPRGFETTGGGAGLPPVITRVPTDEKVIFLTIDDGKDKDPELIRMMRELGVPYSAFLSDFLASEDYPYFHEMQDAGVALNNHTLTHPNLRLMPYEAQRREICGQQERLRREFGTAPRLFRPPFGNYNGDSLRAAASCGVEVVPLWEQEVFPDRWAYRRASRSFQPGDIVLTHFRGRADWKGTMPDVVRQVLRKADAEGFAVARLEDYV